MLSKRLSTLQTAPLADLIAVVLRQFRRPLAAHGLELTDSTAADLAAAAAAHQHHPLIPSLRGALAAAVAESLAVLDQWGLTFQSALDTPMDAIPGWTTTAEFLALAEAKSNAELRIALGAILLYALGDHRYADIVRWLADRAGDPAAADFDSILARRVLSSG
jgi:hypothetical protein